MRILLVKPNVKLDTILKLRKLVILEPLELGYLAAATPEEHEVRIADLRVTDAPDETFEKELREFAPDIVGLSGYTNEASAVKKLASKTKLLFKDSIVVVGGPHATVMTEDYNIKEIDAIVRGEGCIPFRNIVENISCGKALDNIPNVILTGNRFDKKKALAVPHHPDLADLPLPRRDLWDHKNYICVWPSEEHSDFETIFPRVSLMRTSYGCKMNCSFCVIPILSERRHLVRAPEDVADEISQLEADHVYFCDDETFMNADYIKNVAETIKARGIKKKYFAWARSTTVNRRPELFKLWKSVGLDSVFLGFEFVSDDYLKEVSKHSTVADNEQAHRILRSMGIAVIAAFMIKPDFTEEDFDRMEEYMKNMPPAQFNVTICTPSPGSPDWLKQKDKFIYVDLDMHDSMHSLFKTRLPLKRFFERFSRLVDLSVQKNPLNSPENKLSLLDIGRIAKASREYTTSLRNAYKDYPESMWNS